MLEGLIIVAALAALYFAGLAAAIFLISFPSRAAVDENKAGLAVEAVAFPSPSGSTLAGWFRPGTPGEGAVVLMHGIKDNRLRMAARMRFLNQAGYGVLAFDFRAHGESPGGMITFGRLENLDARAAVAWLRSELPGERIGAVCISLGGAAALLGDGPLDVDAIALESVYPDIERAVDGRLSRYLGFLGRLSTPLFLKMGELGTGMKPAELRPIDGLERLAIPVFVVSGAEDRYTSIDETREMFARAREPKDLWEVAGAGHVDLHAFAGGAYETKMLTFFAKTLRGRPDRSPSVRSMKDDGGPPLPESQR